MTESGKLSSDSGEPEVPLWTATEPHPERPILVAGLAASAVLCGSGDIELAREARGGPSEWGGVYGQDVRLTGPWRIRWRSSGKESSLSETVRSITAWRWGMESVHEDSNVRVLQEIAAFESTPGICRTLTFENSGPEATNLEVESTLVPYLSPVILEGVKPYRYRALIESGTVAVSAHGSGFLLDVDPAPDRYSLNREGWDGRTLEGEFSELTTLHSVLVPANGRVRLRWAVTGGTHRWTVSNPEEGKHELTRPVSLLADARARWLEWRSGTPGFSCPDPVLNEGYRLARDALRCLYTAPELGFTGLVAGYPWYSSLWCRDLGWMLPAVLWMGDHEWVAKSLETVFRFQARAPIAIMSAEAGELPMEVCPGPIFLFGTSDTTLYYPGIVRRLWKVSGDRSRVEGFRPVLDRIAGWAERRCDPATGLLRNGGEIEGLKEAGASLGRVHFGIDASDTTIWDSVDRRDHAVDIQALGFEAFQALGDLAETLGLAESATAHRARADALGAAVRERYAWDSEAYLYDSLHSDGTPVAHVRPNALRTVSVGIAPGPLGRRLVERATRDDLSTAWGVRTLASSDADFDPTLYHDGEVWTIATAWAADAALKAGMTEVGLGFLKVNAQRLIDEFGLANECYRGDRAEPFNSCFLLGFSVAPFLTTIFDTLWGLSPQMDGGRIGCSPQFPPGWASARLTGLRLATGRLSLDYAPGRLRAEWDGASPLTLDGPAGSVTLEPGTVGELSLPSPR